METIEDFCKKFELPAPAHTVLQKEYYEEDAVLKKIAGSIKGLIPLSIGSMLGKKGDQFKPSPRLLEYLKEKGAPCAELDEKTSYLFLCGRDVLEAQNAPKGVIILTDEQGRILGYGKKLRDKFSGRPIIKNMWDKGDFLRREMGK